MNKTKQMEAKLLSLINSKLDNITKKRLAQEFNTTILTIKSHFSLIKKVEIRKLIQQGKNPREILSRINISAKILQKYYTKFRTNDAISITPPAEIKGKCKRCGCNHKIIELTNTGYCTICEPFGEHTTPAQKISNTRITIGADPEFIFSQNNSLLPASSVFRRNALSSDVGCDGSDATGELRPKYGHNPEELLHHTRKCLIKLKRVLTQKNMTATTKIMCGSLKHNRSIGGHLHFGIYPVDTSINAQHYQMDLTDTFIKKFKNERLGFNMPTDLQKSFNLISVLVNSTQARDTFKRFQSGYGTLGTTRPQNWGFEYRSLGSWLKTPAYAGGIFAMYYLTIVDFENESKSINKFVKLHDEIGLESVNEMYQNKVINPSLFRDVTKILTALDSARNPEFENSKKLMMNFLSHEPINNTSNGHFECVDFEAWGIHTKTAKPKKHKIMEFNLNDAYVNELQQSIPNVNLTLDHPTINIIGTNESRPPVIFAGLNESVRDIVTRWGEENQIIPAFFESNHWERFNNCVIGFNPTIRADPEKLQKIKELLQRINNHFANTGGN